MSRAFSRLAIVGAIGLAVVGAGCQRATTEARVSSDPPAALDARFAPLRADFDREAGLVRLVVLASPT